MASDHDASYASFVRVHAGSLFRTAYLLTADPEAAEELVQDVLARIYPRWDSVVAAQAPIAYVRRSVVNAFLSQRRRSSSRDVALGPEHDVATRRDLADDVADRDQVWLLLSTLSSRQRAALVLRYFHDQDDAQIAATLGCRVATVRSLVSRALRELRSQQGAPTPFRSPGRSRT